MTTQSQHRDAPMQIMHGKDDTNRRDTDTEGDRRHTNMVKLHII